MANTLTNPSVEVDLGHRAWLGAMLPVRPFQDATLLDSMGGQAAIDRLVDSLHKRFEADPLLRPLFGRDLSTERARQKRFFAEWLGGGTPRYSESAVAALHQRHEDLPITRALAERWLTHFKSALRDAVPGETQAAIIFERAQALAFALVNHQPEMSGQPQTLPWARSAPRHRSERIASCGVGARTLTRGLLLAQRGKLDELATLALEVPDLVQRPAFAAHLLQTATLAGRAPVVEWLLVLGVDVNKPWPLPTGLAGAGFEGILFVTPLCAARMTGRPEIVTQLLHRGAREDVFTASFLGDLPLVRQLLAERPSLAQVSDPATDVLTITPIHHAVAGDQKATLRALLDHAAEPVRTGARALRAAAERGNREMIELLLTHGADAHATGAGRWVLNADIAPLLAAAGASAGVGIDGEASGDWVRISCTGNQGRKDDPGYVASLLRYGAGVDQRYNGATPLHYVVKAGFVRTIQLLIQHGADRDALDDRGRTPSDWLAYAAKSVDRDAVRRTLQAGSGQGPAPHSHAHGLPDSTRANP